MNRYTIMKASDTVTDKNSPSNPKGNNQPWPDPLSIKYSKFFYNTPPTQIAVDDTLKTSPFMITYALYQEASYDDIVSNINNVPHVSLLEDEAIMLYPEKDDIILFSGAPL